MDPMTGALWVGASFVSSLMTNRSVAKTEQAQNRLNTEQSRLQAAETAYERTKNFRRNLSQNLALSGMGFGGVSGFRGITGQNTSDFLGDMAALGRQDTFAQLTGNANRALSKAKRFKNDVGAITNAASLASQLGLFTVGSK